MVKCKFILNYKSNSVGNYKNLALWRLRRFNYQKCFLNYVSMKIVLELEL